MQKSPSTIARRSDPIKLLEQHSIRSTFIKASEFNPNHCIVFYFNTVVRKASAFILASATQFVIKLLPQSLLISSWNMVAGVVSATLYYH